MIPPVCRHIDVVLNECYGQVTRKLREECGCTDTAIARFEDCMYRHNGSIIKYAHNVLRCNNHDHNTAEVTALLMQGGDEAKRADVYEHIRSFMHTVCMYTDSYEH
jgi:hypothetical protein